MIAAIKEWQDAFNKTYSLVARRRAIVSNARVDKKIVKKDDFSDVIASLNELTTATKKAVKVLPRIEIDDFTINSASMT